MKNPNPIQFYVGLVAALGSAAWTFLGLSTQATPFFQLLE